MKKPTHPPETPAAHNGASRRRLVKKALNFVGEHPKMAATALAAGVGAYALVHRAKKKVKRVARKVKKTVAGRRPKGGSRRTTSRRPSKMA